MGEFELQEPPETEVKQTKRGTWANQLDFLMSILGTTVGYGNLWRFPYLCNKNGGGAFLIPFLFFLVTCGLPLFFLEIALGQFSGKSNVHMWGGMCPLFKGIGVGQILILIVCIIYYQNIIAWNIYYMAMSFYPVLPWSTCSNEWNTEHCTDVSTFNRTVANSSVVSYVNRTLTVNGTVELNETGTGRRDIFAHTDVEEFWQHKALGVSDGIHHMGGVQWHLAVSLLVSWMLVFLCTIKGVRSVGKVVYVTALLPYVLLLVLLIRTLMLPGSVHGIVTYLKPDFNKLLDVQVWLDALIQVFYSLGPGWGIIVTLSSYNRFHDNFLRNSCIISFAGEGTSLFSGFVIFTVLGFMSHRANVDISEVASSGPGLAFVVYPEGLSALPLPQLWNFLFFFMMVTVGLDCEDPFWFDHYHSIGLDLEHVLVDKGLGVHLLHKPLLGVLFAWTETVTTVLLDQFPNTLRKRRILVSAILCTTCYLLGLFFTTEGGIYYFQIVDWYIGAFSLILFAILECIIVSWIYGARRFSDDVELMLGRRVPAVFTIMLAYVTPVFLAISLVLVLWKFKPPTYGKYVYPEFCEVIGWILATMSIIPFPIFAAIALYKAKGNFMLRLNEATTPDSTWKPASKEHEASYQKDDHQRELSCVNPRRP